jgi:hypothetical protein
MPLSSLYYLDVYELTYLPTNIGCTQQVCPWSKFHATAWFAGGGGEGLLQSGPCYKTFYHRNLLPFHGIAVILCFKTILSL